MNRSIWRDCLVGLVLMGIVAIVAPLARGSSIVLTDAQREKLGRLVREDARARELFERVARDADAALAARPDPVAVILTEGKLQSDPVKVRTWESLGDMPKLGALGYAFAVTGKREYAEKIREFVMAWAKVNHSAGDPIDDTNYEPLLDAYDVARETFPRHEREVADAWLHGIANEEVRTGSLDKETSFNNWNSHRIKIVGLIAFVLQDRSMIDGIEKAYRKQIEKNLNPDGSSWDFHKRDALHYQVYDLEPLLALCIAARNNGIDLYDYQAPSGASVAKSVAFVVPFVEGTQQHAEFVHSTVAFDQQRAASGQAEYKAGRLWDAHAGLLTMELDEAFDPSVRRLVVKLAGDKVSAEERGSAGFERFPTWRIVVNEAERGGK